MGISPDMVGLIGVERLFRKSYHDLLEKARSTVVASARPI